MTGVKFALIALNKNAILIKSGANLSVTAARIIVLAGVRNCVKIGLTIIKQNIGVDSLSKLTNIRHQTSGQNF